MLALKGCALKASSATSDAECFAGVQSFHEEAKRIHKFWTTRVATTGGVNGTKNKNEKDNLEKASWALDGSLAG